MRLSRKPYVLFAAVTIPLLVALVLDQHRLRPRQIPTPASADSLAGVVVRVAGFGDSALVRRVTWWQSPERTLGWFDVGEEYAYKGGPGWRDLSPIGARVDSLALTITFAKGQLVDEQIKHEIGHLALHEPHHPADLFRRIENYRGR